MNNLPDCSRAEPPGSNLRLTADQVTALARPAGKCLFEELEKLDPAFEKSWEDLSDKERALFEYAIENVLIRLFTIQA